jgi:uncharacterized protein YjiS (DUF1127 family)
MRDAARFLPIAGWFNPLLPLKRYIANRRTVHVLATLDDRQLADIGLTRLDIEWADTLPASSDLAGELDRVVRRYGRLARREDV